MNYYIKSKTILITGVGKGIGSELLNFFTNKDYFVYGVTRSFGDYKKLKKLSNSKIFYGDVRNKNIIKKILNDFIKNKRPISGLVNNAGVRHREKLLNIKENDLKKTFETNFLSVFFITQSYLKYCLKNKIKSSIVNIGSIVGGDKGFDELSSYASSKGALKSFTQSLAVEVAKHGIRANLVNPGFIKTSYFKKFNKNKKKLYNWTLSRIPQKRWGEARELSGLVSFLLSDDSSYLTGETINIDGGWVNS